MFGCIFGGEKKLLLSVECVSSVFCVSSLRSVLFSVLIFRLVVPNKGYSSLDQSPDEKPLVALDTDRYVHYLVFFISSSIPPQYDKVIRTNFSG